MMSPSDGGWNDPPPPGTEVPQEYMDDSAKEVEVLHNESQDDESLDQKVKIVDPFLKNPEYLEYEKRRHSRSRDRSKHRRRSHSRSRHSEKHKKRYRSRSRSRERHKRSRSHNRRHRRRRSSSSGRSRHSKSKREKKHKRSRSRSRRRSKSRSRRQYSKPRHNEARSDSEKEDPTSGEVEDDEEPLTKENAFKNDGSFLEMFKKMQEEQQKAAEAAKDQATSSDLKNVPPVPKRRGGRILKTGMVEKAKVIDEFMQGEGLDPWSVYMKEVKRYKEACCDDDSKTRPLVK